MTISIRIGYLAENGQTQWIVEGGGEDVCRPSLADAISEAARRCEVAERELRCSTR